MADREWNETTPANTDNFNQGAAKIREHKEDTRQRAEVDHYWQTDRTYDGEHKKVTLRDTTDPTNASGKSFLYAKDNGGTSNVYMEDSDGNVYQLLGIDSSSASNLSTPIAGWLNDGTPYYKKEINITIAVNQTTGSTTHGISNAKTNNLILDAVPRSLSSGGSVYEIKYDSKSDGSEADEAIRSVQWNDTNIYLVREQGSGSAEKTYTVIIDYK